MRSECLSTGPAVSEEWAVGKLMTASSDVRTIAESSVGVETDQATGSGTVIGHVGRSSLVLTCEHVVRGAKKARIVYRVGKRFLRVDGTVAQADSALDLALIRVPKLALPTLPIAVEEPELYAKLWVVGSAEGYFGTACEALLCARDGSNGDPDEAYQLSGFASPGASGGTIADHNGQLVAVLTGIRHNGHQPIHGIVFAVPLPKIRGFLSEPPRRRKRKSE